MVVSVKGAYIINPRRIRVGYGNRSVCLFVCLSVTRQAATYLVIRLLVVISSDETYGISSECFVQKLWRHLLIISVFFASRCMKETAIAYF